MTIASKGMTRRQYLATTGAGVLVAGLGVRGPRRHWRRSGKATKPTCGACLLII